MRDANTLKYEEINYRTNDIIHSSRFGKEGKAISI